MQPESHVPCQPRAAPALARVSVQGYGLPWARVRMRAAEGGLGSQAACTRPLSLALGSPAGLHFNTRPRLTKGPA